MNKCPRCNIEWKEKYPGPPWNWFACDCGLEKRQYPDGGFSYYDDHSASHFLYPTTWYSNGKCIIHLFNNEDMRECDDVIELTRWISFDLEKAKAEIDRYLLLM